MRSVFAPLPPLAPATVRKLSQYNREMGSKYGVSTQPWYDRRYNGTGDPRMVEDLRKVQRFMGLSPTGRLDPPTMARMLAHIEANTKLGRALRMNFVFRPNPVWGSPYNVVRPSIPDLRMAKKREQFLLARGRRARAAAVAKRPQAKVLSTRHARPGSAAPASRPAAALPVRQTTVPGGQPFVFSPAWWARFRQNWQRRQQAARPVSHARPAQGRPVFKPLVARVRRCVCGYSRAELHAGVNRLNIA